jgi:hypothetical protein
MARTHKPRLFGDSLPDVTLPRGDSSSFVTLKALFRRPGSIHAEEPARRTPELFWEASPVVERQRPAAQARIARDRIVLVDAAQWSRMSVAQVTSRCARFCPQIADIVDTSKPRRDYYPASEAGAAGPNSLMNRLVCT